MSRTVSRTTCWKSTYVCVEISPRTMTSPVVVAVSHATRADVSSRMIASRMASEIWSAILSGWPSVTDSDVNKIRFFVVEVGGKILFSLENCFGRYFFGESRGALCSLRAGSGTRSLLLGPIIMTIKRLTDGCGARNGFGPKGRRASSIAELWWWMEGFVRRAGKRGAGDNPGVRGIPPFKERRVGHQ